MTEHNIHDTTISDILKLIFPKGTRIAESSETEPQWNEIPTFAADIFAYCGYLIQVTGLMGFFEPDPTHQKRFKANQALKITLNVKGRTGCMKASKTWQKSGKIPLLAKQLWKIIDDAKEESVVIRRIQAEHAKASNPQECPKWWTAVFQLLIIADEACEGIGHYYEDENAEGVNKVPDLWLFAARHAEMQEAELANIIGTSELPEKYDLVPAEKYVSSLGLLADRNIVCVQPKCRVAQVGCSVRNLSRNLALTGPAGNVRCNWRQLPANAIKPKQLRDAMNILLIPSPTEMNAKAFKGKEPCDTNWGVFDIEQEWLHEDLRNISNPADIKDENGAWIEYVARVDSIITKATQDSGRVDAIIFPELSITYPIFSRLFKYLISKEEPNDKLRFMIAGTKGNCENNTGNHVMTAINEKVLVNTSKSPVREFSQRKHHRWKVGKDQIATYGIGSALSPHFDWWENHSIETRELNFFQLRRDTIFASLICEDLARNDPCHDIMRSVAPNLVFALLMDGPQLANRWPARYASTLAEDPGSTVITLTSYGLVSRSNDQFTDRKSHSVGLLRDSRGTTREIILQPGDDAILLTLGSSDVVDKTIDSRPTNNASEWYYISQKSLKCN
jgi:hypothetical protein